ncbi:MAG: TonB-dependent receptor [Chitinophagales bacterium]|nr:TonB-dependent receptor [Chitinophagales bacterium]
MKKHLLIICMAALLPSMLFAQTTISGNVKDNNGIPLIGVTVAEKGTTNGTYTDADGNYSLGVSNASAIITFSYIGFAPMEITATGTTLNAVMQDATTELTGVEIIGSRSLNRSITESPVPVDYIDIKKMSDNMGQLDVNQLLHYLAPSFNANKQSGSDGADHTDPATLRGLGPDQTLVLVNGKRRHQSSLINIYGTRGRGNTGSDLNTIPVSAIDHIEILRDGAAAQYGSDAIAGVINIVLKKSTGEFTGGVNTATNIAKYRFDDETFDGNEIQFNGNYGVKIGDKGFINFTTDYLFHGATNRANIPADWYPGNTDVRNQFGDAEATNFSTWLNSEIGLGGGATLYAFGGFSNRSTNAFAFTRVAGESRNVDEIYPNGFDPIIQSQILDKSLSFGVRGAVGNWNTDFNNSYGSNRFHFYGDHTNNASLGAASPTSFDDGGTQLAQNVTTLDFTRYFKNCLSGVNVAFGGEYRVENYKIFAGEEGSWQTYGPLIFSIDSVFDDYGIFAGLDTSYRPGGSQGFPGFRPSNEVDKYRSNLAGYVDAEFNFTDAFMIDVALRAENYSDFGSTVNGKLAARYAINDQFAIRGSGSTGFRAPSLAQIYYNQTFTNVQNGVIFDAVIANNQSNIARALGIPALKQETSTNGSLGFTVTPGNGFSATIDGYYVSIKDRIVLTGNFYNDDPIIGATLDEQGVTAAQFFTNAVDTRTYGLDFILNYAWYMNNDSRLTFSLVGNINHMEVTAVHTNDLLEGKEDSYFWQRDSAFLTASAPPYKINFGIGYNHKKFNAGVHFNFWSKLLFYDYDPKPYWYKSSITVDLNLGYNITKNLSLNIGAVNLGNAYPTYYNPDGAKVGSEDAIGYDPYQTESGGSWDAVQMGFGGMLIYGKIGFKF